MIIIWLKQNYKGLLNFFRKTFFECGGISFFLINLTDIHFIHFCYEIIKIMITFSTFMNKTKHFM